MAVNGTHLSFQLTRTQLSRGILIPKYYDPDLKHAEELANDDFELVELGDLLLAGQKGSRLGSWVPREHYGTGPIPYVRTSDMANWRLRPDYKKAVSKEIYESLRAIQDVQPYDILFVAHGTYLVGTVAVVLPGQEQLVLQDHVFRLRVNPASKTDPRLLLAALSTSFVRRQVRARQFSADIIDKIGERHLSIKVPIPRNRRRREAIAAGVADVLSKQDAARDEIAKAASLQTLMTKERAESNLGFSVGRRALRERILIPKFYDPRIAKQLKAIQAQTKEAWVPLRSFIDAGLLSATTGVEVGKMAYGTGPVPFLRTTDVVGLEIRRDARHCVSEEVLEANRSKAGVNAGDVLLVRDGTYLVGSSALVNRDDGAALVCGGVYRLRSLAPESLKPASLLLALNLPHVRAQFRTVQFTRDVIDTLGKRALDVLVPPLQSKRWSQLGDSIQASMNQKALAKAGIGKTILLAEPSAPEIVKGRPSWSMR